MHQRPYRHIPVPLRKLPHRLVALEARQPGQSWRLSSTHAWHGPGVVLFPLPLIFFFYFLISWRPLRFQRSAASTAQPRITSGQILTRLRIYLTGCTPKSSARTSPYAFFFLLTLQGAGDGTTAATRRVRGEHARNAVFR